MPTFTPTLTFTLILTHTLEGAKDRMVCLQKVLLSDEDNTAPLHHPHPRGLLRVLL